MNQQKVKSKKQRYTEDIYQQLSRKNNIRARSYFKLKEIDEKFKIIHSYYNILDLGGAPGSWAQYCFSVPLYHGHVFSVDLTSIEPIPDFNHHCLIKDVSNLNKTDIDHDIHLVISDMAPKTIGNHFVDSSRSEELVYKALQIAIDYLQSNDPKRWFICKYLEGDGSMNLKKIITSKFKKTKIFKPKSSRSFSTEVFFIANELK